MLDPVWVQNTGGNTEMEEKKIFSLPFGTSSGREGLVIGGMMTGCVISAIFVTGEHDAKGPLSRGTWGGSKSLVWRAIRGISKEAMKWILNGKQK